MAEGWGEAPPAKTNADTVWFHVAERQKSSPAASENNLI
jgi:hypothetical protein